MTEARHSAFVVANDAYEDKRLRRLRAPAADAEELGRVLRDPEIGGFEVDVSMNEPEHVVRRKLSAFFDDRGLDDLLVLHLSCHGLKDDDGRLYFATADTELDHLEATAIPSEFVNRQMTRSRSRRIVLLLDCCYSGAFAAGMLSRAGDRVEIKERFDGRGRVVLTASSSMEYSFEGDQLEGEGRPSVFTSALVRGLATGAADRNRDGWISIDELYDFAYDEVRAVTPSQTPGKWVFDVQGDLFVARSRIEPPADEVALTPELLSASVSPFAHVRAGAVQELGALMHGPDEGLAAVARATLEKLALDDSSRVGAAVARIFGDPADGGHRGARAAGAGGSPSPCSRRAPGSRTGRRAGARRRPGARRGVRDPRARIELRGLEPVRRAVAVRGGRDGRRHLDRRPRAECRSRLRLLRGGGPRRARDPDLGRLARAGQVLARTPRRGRDGARRGRPLRRPWHCWPPASRVCGLSPAGAAVAPLDPAALILGLGGAALSTVALFVSYDGFSSLWSEVGEVGSAEFFFEPMVAVVVMLAGLVALGTRPRFACGLLLAVGMAGTLHFLGVIVAAWRAIGEVGEVQPGGFDRTRRRPARRRRRRPGIPVGDDGLTAAITFRRARSPRRARRRRGRPAIRVDTITSSASSGRSFQTERTVPGATRTACRQGRRSRRRRA